MLPILSLLAQMDSKLLPTLNDGSPPFSADASYAMAWIILGLLTTGILLVTFKTSRRNRLLDQG